MLVGMVRVLNGLKLLNALLDFGEVLRQVM
jgi:hypothetical protein